MRKSRTRRRTRRRKQRGGFLNFFSNLFNDSDYEDSKQERGRNMQGGEESDMNQNQDGGEPMG